jgi:dTDP-4-amino-4,6-dideoxygalactose transaminase
MHGRRFWHPIHTQPPHRASGDNFPNSTRQIPRAMWLPSAFNLSDEDVAEVCAEVRSFFETPQVSGTSRERERRAV